MTVLDATNILWKWFTTNDCLRINSTQNDDFLKIFLVSDDEERDRALLTIALEQFEQSGILRRKDDFWFLSKPFSQYEQSVSISAPLAGGIATTINTFCEKIKNQVDVCDPSKVTAKDIENLLVILTVADKLK